jgi:hypothetical protein
VVVSSVFYCRLFLKHTRSLRDICAMAKKRSSSSSNTKKATSKSVAGLPADVADLIVSELQTHIDTHDLPGLAKYVVLLDTLVQENKLASINEATQKRWMECADIARGMLREWRAMLTLNDNIDFLNNEGAWYLVKIISAPINHIARVHFQGWDKKYDQDVDLFSEVTVQPPNTFVVSRRKAVRQSTAADAPIVLEEELENATNALIVPESLAEVEAKCEVEEVVEGASSSRRRSLKRVSEPDEPAVAQSVKKTKRGKQEKDNNDWVCSVCSMLEAPQGSDLLLCDGPCRRSFHAECLHLDAKDVPDSWICAQCTEGKHVCFVCCQEGLDLVVSVVDMHVG